ncbi:zf-HC2 domain-containing protein [Terrilactibacillus sp. S3-3]|nr:zf-HC2 domain-containing protein [Terrilactibacillus sp. S3-3]
MDDLLSAYIDGELERKDSEQVKEHLRHCSRCRKELEQLSAAASAFSMYYRPIEAPADTVSKIMLKIDLRKQRREKWEWLLVFSFLACSFLFTFILLNPMFRIIYTVLAVLITVSVDILQEVPDAFGWFQADSPLAFLIGFAVFAILIFILVILMRSLALDRRRGTS